jgi:hypothetical protein
MRLTSRGLITPKRTKGLQHLIQESGFAGASVIMSGFLPAANLKKIGIGFGDRDVTSDKAPAGKESREPSLVTA